MSCAHGRRPAREERTRSVRDVPRTLILIMHRDGLFRRRAREGGGRDRGTVNRSTAPRSAQTAPRDADDTVHNPLRTWRAGLGARRRAGRRPLPARIVGAALTDPIILYYEEVREEWPRSAVVVPAAVACRFHAVFSARNTRWGKPRFQAPVAECAT